MRKLTALYIGENEIYFIDSNAFSGLRNLVHLDFSRNQAFDEKRSPKNLATDRYYAFQDLVSLVSLDMSYTKLTQRNLGMIESLGTNLRSLSLCNTGLNSLPENIFNDTPLVILDVSRNNGILNLKKALGGLERSLAILYAQEIGLQTMNILEGFVNLMILQLSYNEIGYVPNSTVKSLRKLKILDLKNNRINSWFHQTFCLMPQLQFLSLANNNINIITEEMIDDLLHVDYLAMSGNFLVCNCLAKDFYKMAAKNEIIFGNNLIREPEGQLPDLGFQFYNNVIQNRSQIYLENCNNDCFEDIGPTSGRFRFVDYSNDPYECIEVPDSKTVSISDVKSCGRARGVNYEGILDSGKHKLLALLVIPCFLVPFVVIYAYRRHIRYFYITMRNSAMLSLISQNDAIDGKHKSILIYNM